jgi:hypothetical protein
MPKMYYRSVIGTHRCVEVNNFCSLRIPSDVTDPKCIGDWKEEVR